MAIINRLIIFQILLTVACTRVAEDRPDISPEILSEVNRIRAIDNHAHPVRFVSAGEQDREFDAMPVDNLESSSDPLQLRPTDPGLLPAWRALWNYPYSDVTPQRRHECKVPKQ